VARGERRDPAARQVVDHQRGACRGARQGEVRGHAAARGIRAGRQLQGGLWLSLGFNRFGYYDEELAGEEWTREGAYVRLRNEWLAALGLAQVTAAGL